MTAPGRYSRDSAYGSDLRVAWPWSGSGWPPDVVAIVADPEGQHDGWVILPDGRQFMARLAVSPDADPTVGDRRGFATPDDAIRALIGDPR